MIPTVNDLPTPTDESPLHEDFEIHHFSDEEIERALLAGCWNARDLSQFLRAGRAA